MPVGTTHVAAASHLVITPFARPHVMPAVTRGWVTHMFVVVLQVSPPSMLQSAPVLCLGSQVPPAVAISAMQVPFAGGVTVVPTQVNPSAHGRSRLHAPPDATGAWHSIVVAMQLSS